MGCFNSKDDKLLSQKFSDTYQMGDQIGKGAFSVVHVATNKKTKQKVAVKVIKKKGFSKDDEIALRQEVDILEELRHPNIVRLVDFHDEPDSYKVSLEYLEGGELFERIVAKTYYNEKEARDLVLILLSSIKYCHDNDVVHRDLKPENLLMASTEDDALIKVADFGFACVAPGLTLTSRCGTPNYVSPEILNDVPYGKPADMWAIGVITYILLGGYPPFHDEVQKKLFALIKAGTYEFHEDYWCTVSAEAKDLIAGLLTLDQKKRLTVDMALQHSWITRDGGELASRNLDSNLVTLRRFNAKRKFRAGIKAIIAVNRFKNIAASFKKAGSSLQQDDGNNAIQMAEKVKR